MSRARKTAYSAPAGVVLPFAGAVAPRGWLLCHGQAVSRATYADLFEALGTTYGAGDGSTTFNLPDLRGRVPGGKDDMGGAAAGRLTVVGSGVNGATLGAAGGGETHTLSTTQMPAHNHGVNDPGHGHAASQDDHTHTVGGLALSRSAAGYGLAAPGSGYTERVALFPGATTTSSAGSSGASAGAVYIGGSATGISTQDNGLGGAHNNTQPTLVLNYIIKT